MSHGRKLRKLLITFPLSVLTMASAIGATPDDQHQGIKFSVDHDDELIGLDLTWVIAPDSFLYRDTIKAMIDGRPIKMVSAPGLRIHPSTSTREIYRGLAMANTIEDLPQKGELRITYQECKQNATCDPPITQSIDLETLSVRRYGPGDSSSATNATNTRRSAFSIMCAFVTPQWLRTTFHRS